MMKIVCGKKSKTMNKGLKSLALMISLFWGCHVWAGENIKFPEIPGWKLNVNEHVYNAGDLWELINGAADIFLSYYFEDLLIGEYTQKEVADMMGISQSYISRLEKRIIVRLGREMSRQMQL